jgi:hypothetical protein
VERVTGKPAGDEAVLPREAQHLWGAFMELSRTRTVSMALSAITYAEIAAWCGLKQEDLDPWEVEAIRDVDEIFLRVSREE